MLAKKIALGFGIAVVFPLLIHYGVSTFVYSPKWQDYQVRSVFDPYASAADKARREVEQEKKQEEYKASEKYFEKRLFAVAVPFGLIALVAGAFLSLPALGTGLMFGGIFSIGDGYFNYWSELTDALKFGSLLVTFALLLFLSYRRLERKAEAS
jgi:hypothetical protein